MLDGFREWLSYGPNAALFFLFIVVTSSLICLLINEQPVAAPEAPTQVFVELPEPKPILKSISWVYDNQNITYLPAVFSVTNEQNYSVQLLMNFLSEPEALMEYVSFSISHENNTIVQPGESLALSVSLTTFTNPNNLTGEYYLTVYGEPT